MTEKNIFSKLIWRLQFKKVPFILYCTPGKTYFSICGIISRYRSVNFDIGASIFVATTDADIFGRTWALTILGMNRAINNANNGERFL